MNKHKYIKNKIVVIGAFIVGILISTYLKTLDTDRVYITLNDKKEIESQIKSTLDRIDQLKSLKENQQKVLHKYEKVLNNNIKSLDDLLIEELNYYKKYSGYISVIGQGIAISISDSDRELKKGQNPNDLIVHDIDILRIVNDLRKSGAEAISINDERVLSSTSIKCSGATITINETTHGQPFVIKAIGNINMLKACLISPDSYAVLLKEVYGINMLIQEKNDIYINKYEKYI